MSELKLPINKVNGVILPPWKIKDLFTRKPGDYHFEGPKIPMAIPMHIAKLGHVTIRSSLGIENPEALETLAEWGATNADSPSGRTQVYTILPYAGDENGTLNPWVDLGYSSQPTPHAPWKRLNWMSVSGEGYIFQGQDVRDDEAEYYYPVEAVHVDVRARV